MFFFWGGGGGGGDTHTSWSNRALLITKTCHFKGLIKCRGPEVNLNKMILITGKQAKKNRIPQNCMLAFVLADFLLCSVKA